MQFPSANSDLFILAPSISLNPLLLVFEARSEPAKSIKDNFPKTTYELIPLALSLYSTLIYKIA